MTDTRPSDQPNDRHSPLPDQIPVVDAAPPLAPADHAQSPWWSAPSGRPFSIPDFAHEFRAILAWLFPTPAPAPVLIPVRVKNRRR